ncbi:MAG: alkaline phosphatase [Verrucomicrobiota bacterium]
MNGNKWIVFIVAGAMVVGMSVRADDDGGRRVKNGPKKAKNIIFMVPDGMGLSDVTAARIFKGGPDGDPLSFELLKQTGYQRTHSANSTVTDSSAAAAAWATGDKYNNGQISWHSDTDMPETILEIAKKKGKATGLVATSDITHATPAAFGAHVSARKSEGEIARQYIEETEVDVLLGGGIANNRSNSPLPPEDLEALVDSATNEYGYAYADTLAELESATCGGKILGLFKQGGKTLERFRVDPANSYPLHEPTLPEMTKAALKVLSRDKDGFFLMVEGSQIDWRNHAHDIKGMIAETLAFEESVKVVIEWLDSEPSRWMHTLLIVVPDHETGGFQINGPYGRLSKTGDIVEAGWTTGSHTAVDTLVWSEGVGSEYLGGPMDNTDIFHVMKQVLK